MKKIIAIATFMCICTIALAQQVRDTTPMLKLPEDPVLIGRFKAKLVELALSNPQVTQFDIQREINKYDTRIAKAEWLNRLTVAGNLNEFTLKSNSGSGNQNFYPRYNFGLLLPVGQLIAIPNTVKRAKANGRLVDQQKDAVELQIKGQVLRMYEQYLADKELFKLHKVVMDEVQASFILTEQKFGQNDAGVSLDAYTAASRAYNEEKIKHILLDRDMRQSKIDLEAIVGVKLEEVLLMVQ